MIGVNFQPGAQDQMSGGRPSNPNQGVQEAIKVLSLRLPKTVGAQAVAPQGLLQSLGGAGTRVDSVVNQVLSKMFPGTASPSSEMPSFGMAPTSTPEPSAWGGSVGGDSAPSFSGVSAPPSYPAPTRQSPSDAPNIYGKPRVVVDNPLGHGDFTVGGDGRPAGPGGVFAEAPSLPNFDGSGFPPATIAPTPKRSPFGDWLNSYGGGGSNEPDQPPAF